MYRPTDIVGLHSCNSLTTSLYTFERVVEHEFLAPTEDALALLRAGLQMRPWPGGFTQKSPRPVDSEATLARRFIREFVSAARSQMEGSDPDHSAKSRGGNGRG